MKRSAAVTAASTHLEIWDKLKRVPPEHLKGFQRAGGFKGTAIKPMWTIHRMTEVFGPVGQAWGIDEPRFQVIPAGDEILVYCTVSVWLMAANNFGPVGGRFCGVGGDKVRAMFNSGPKNDDEAFKKAYTDALTNALKMLGAGADVHMGLWDGNKYADEPKNITPHEDHHQSSGPQLLTRDEARKLYKTLQAELVNLGTVREVSQWEKERLLEISKLGDWRSYMDKEIAKHLDYIEQATPREAAE
jgi:hypothetical protein